MTRPRGATLSESCGRVWVGGGKGGGLGSLAGPWSCRDDRSASIESHFEGSVLENRVRVPKAAGSTASAREALCSRFEVPPGLFRACAHSGRKHGQTARGVRRDRRDRHETAHETALGDSSSPRERRSIRSTSTADIKSVTTRKEGQSPAKPWSVPRRCQSSRALGDPETPCDFVNDALSGPQEERTCSICNKESDHISLVEVIDVQHKTYQ